MAMTYITKLKPEPMGAHNLSTAYGVNSLVMSGDGAAAYISVKDVPAGTPLTNADYWKKHTDLTAVRQSADAAAQRANAARDEMLEIARNLTDIVEKSGNPVQAELVGGLPFDRVATALAPIQAGSGDPSPNNIRSISGWTGAKLTRCGKNLIPTINSSFSNNGVSFTLNINGSITATGAKTGYSGGNGISVSAVAFRGKTLTITTPNPIYIKVGLKLTNTSGETSYIDAPHMEGSYTFTMPEDANTMAYNFYVNTSGAFSYTFYPQLELGSTATAYEPYQGDTYSADFGQTVYGGTLDWNTGVMTVDKAFVEYDGSADENWLTQTTATDGYRRFRIVPGNAEPNTDSANVAYAVSNMYKAVSPNGTYSKTTGVCVNQNELMIYDADRATLTVDGWKAWLSEHPVQIVYKLATPTTIQLTPQEIKQLQGANTLYGDGSISMTGRADKALALEARIAALEAAG